MLNPKSLPRLTSAQNSVLPWSRVCEGMPCRRACRPCKASMSPPEVRASCPAGAYAAECLAAGTRRTPHAPMRSKTPRSCDGQQRLKGLPSSKRKSLNPKIINPTTLKLQGVGAGLLVRAAGPCRSPAARPPRCSGAAGCALPAAARERALVDDLRSAPSSVRPPTVQ